jgi:hypothetical protein
MADDVRPVPDRRDHHIYLQAIEGLREDVREDIGHLRDDMREDNERLEKRMVAMVTDFIVAHGAEHKAQRESSDEAHGRFDAFIRSAELAQARRDGALGVFRFVLEQISRHWKPITAVLGGLAAVLLALSGSVSIEVVAG